MIFVSGERSFKQSMLGRLPDVNDNLRAHLIPSPTPPAKKVFTAKYEIPILRNYEVGIYPPEYWSGWIRVPLTGSGIQPWLNVPEFRRQLEQVGIDTTTESVSLILNYLQFGADVWATGRARLPTTEENARSAFTYGDRLQEALQSMPRSSPSLRPSMPSTSPPPRRRRTTTPYWSYQQIR